MASSMSRSIQHLLRRHAASSAPALSAISIKPVTGGSLQLNSIAPDLLSAGGATNLGLSGRSIDMALLGRVDWPVLPSSGVGEMLAKKGDSDEEFDDEDDDDSDFVVSDESGDEDLSEDYTEEEDDDEEELPAKPKSKRN